MAFSVGQTVGDYQIIDVLGSGGMGTVYKVRHLISDRLEAIKLVLPELTENPDLMERFMREIKVQARLSHPGIASLHNALRIDHQLLMVMELVEGKTLHNILRNGALVPSTAVDIVLQVLDALEYAHSQGVVHRDIKPANIMISSQGKVKLMDFGIARSLSEDHVLTQAGAAVGSIYYMSPEQVQGQLADARSDLYSTGILLYEMTTGTRPITGEGSYAVMNGHLHNTPRSPSAVNPELPVALSTVILKAIEKNRESRFQSARAFSESLLTLRARVSGATYATPLHSASMQETELATPSMRPPVIATQMPAASSSRTGQTSESSSSTAKFDPERLERLTRDLASFVGPMAKVLVNRAAKKAQTWAQLYEALAPEVPEGTERRQFLSKRP